MDDFVFVIYRMFAVSVMGGEETIESWCVCVWFMCLLYIFVFTCNTTPLFMLCWC